MTYQEASRPMFRAPWLTGVLTAVLAALLLAPACGDSDRDGGTPEGDRIDVVASTAIIAEFTETVGGDAVDVTTLIPAGTDIHSFEPAPATAASVAQAEVVFVNGYNLEEGLLDVVLENVRDGVGVVPVAAGLTPLAGGDAHEGGDAESAAGDIIRAEGDPHFWLDVSNAIHYVEQIRDHLASLDPDHAADYEQRAAAYIEELHALDAEVAAKIATIPEGHRQLVVLHDAYQYFAAAYGLDLTAALLPAGAQSDPSAAEVADLIDLIKELSIPVVFREPQFSASVLESIADETGVELMVLYSTLAADVDTYEALMRADAAAVVEGLGGSEAAS